MFRTKHTPVLLVGLLAGVLATPGCDDSNGGGDPPPANLAGIYNATTSNLGVGDPIVFREDGTFVLSISDTTLTFTAGTPGTTPDSIDGAESNGPLSGNGSNGQIDPGEEFVQVSSGTTTTITFLGDNTLRYVLTDGTISANTGGFWTLTGTNVELFLGSLGIAEFNGTEMYLNSSTSFGSPFQYTVSGGMLTLFGQTFTSANGSATTIDNGSPWRRSQPDSGAFTGYQEVDEISVVGDQFSQNEFICQTTDPDTAIGGFAVTVSVNDRGTGFLNLEYDLRTEFELNASGTRLAFFLTEIGSFIRPQERGATGVFEIAFEGRLFTQNSADIETSDWQEEGGDNHLVINANGTWIHYSTSGTSTIADQGRWFRQGDRIIMSQENVYEE